MEPLQRLLDIEEIKQLKGRYQRAVDTKDWDLMLSVFAPDAISVYSDGKHSFNDRESIVNFLREGLDTIEVQTMHHAHTPEIEILSSTTAKGTWYLEDIVKSMMPRKWAPHGTTMHGTGIYRDRYSKIEGKWLIQETGYERIWEDFQARTEGSWWRTRWDEKK